MAKEELDTVLALDTNTIQLMAGRLRAYYGSNDSWCPLSTRDNLLKASDALFEEDAVIDELGIQHDFVLYSAKQLGEIIGKWTREEWRTSAEEIKDLHN